MHSASAQCGVLNDVTITRIVNGKKIELWGMAYYIWCFHLPSLIRLQRALGRRTCAANTLLNGTIWFLGPILYETLGTTWGEADFGGSWICEEGDLVGDSGEWYDWESMEAASE